MVRLLWDIASLGELASGVPLRPWITFHMFGPSELDIASWRRFFQLSVLVSFIALVASRQASIHSWWFWWIVWRRWWWSFDGDRSMVSYSMFSKVTNSNDYRGIWAVNLLHALQLLAPLTHKAQWVTLHKKWSFSLRVFSVNASKSTGNCRFGRIYWRNP